MTLSALYKFQRGIDNGATTFGAGFSHTCATGWTAHGARQRECTAVLNDTCTPSSSSTAENNYGPTVIGVIGAVVGSLIILAAAFVVWRLLKGKRSGASGAQAPSKTPSIAMSASIA